MFSKITIKRAMKWTAGRAAAVLGSLKMPDWNNTACILAYHRVAHMSFIDPVFDDWNVAPEILERQIVELASVADVVPLLELPALLSAPVQRSKPLVSLTFDDGYASFFTNALPLLKKYSVPATVFVVTAAVGNSGPMPFDSWSQKNAGRVPAEVSRSVTWKELETCISSGLVTVGSHSHEHRNGLRCSHEQLAEEAARSRCELLSRLGQQHAKIYAYPYGSVRLGQVSPDYVSVVKHAGYEMAVTTEPAHLTHDADLYRLPRVEVHGLDSPRVVRAKAHGVLMPFWITDRLRAADRPTPDQSRAAATH